MGRSFGSFIFRGREEARESREISREESRADVHSIDRARRDARQAVREERARQIQHYALEKEKLKGEKRIKSLRSGGFTGSFLRGLDKVTRPPAQQREAYPSGSKRKKRRRSRPPPRQDYGIFGGGRGII